MIALAALVGGCGSQDGHDAGRGLAAAVEQTNRGGPLAISEIGIEHSGPNERVVLRVTGSAYAAGREARLKVVSTREGKGPPSADARETDEVDGELAVRRERLLFRSPGVQRRLGLPTPGVWIEIDATDPRAPSTGLMGNPALGPLDPTRPADHLRAAERVRRVGTDDIGTHYRMTIDYDEYVRRLGPAQRRQLQPKVEQVRRRIGVSRYEADAWVGPSGHIARITGAIRNVTGRDLVTYTLDLRPTRGRPKIPEKSVRLEELNR